MSGRKSLEPRASKEPRLNDGTIQDNITHPIHADLPPIDKVILRRVI